MPKVNRAATRTQFTFYHEAPRNSWYPFNKTQKMKGWVVLEATQWLSAQDHWIGNPAPWPINTFLFFHGWYSMKARYVIIGTLTLTIKKSIGSRRIFQGSALKTVFSVLFFSKCIKKKNFRSTWSEQFYLVLFYPFSYSSRFWIQETVMLGARVRFQAFFFWKKLCFSVFLLKSIEDKGSRFISGEQFHLMVLVSFLFRIQI